MWTCTTAAPAAWHSFAVVTSSSRVTGSAGTAVLSASAPVGATVIKVAWLGDLLVMTRACLLPPGRVQLGLGEVAAGEGGRPGPGGPPRVGRCGRGGGDLEGPQGRGTHPRP